MRHGRHGGTGRPLTAPSRPRRRPSPHLSGSRPRCPLPPHRARPSHWFALGAQPPPACPLDGSAAPEVTTRRGRLHGDATRTARRPPPPQNGGAGRWGGKVPRVLVAPRGARRPDGAFFCVKFVFQSRSIHVHDQKATLPLLAQHLVLHVTVLIN